MTMVMKAGYKVAEVVIIYSHYANSHVSATGNYKPLFFV